MPYHENIHTIFLDTQITSCQDLPMAEVIEYILGLLYTPKAFNPSRVCLDCGVWGSRQRGKPSPNTLVQCNYRVSWALPLSYLLCRDTSHMKGLLCSPSSPESATISSRFDSIALPDLLVYLFSLLGKKVHACCAKLSCEEWLPTFKTFCTPRICISRISGTAAVLKMAVFYSSTSRARVCLYTPT